MNMLLNILAIVVGIGVGVGIGIILEKYVFKENPEDNRDDQNCFSIWWVIIPSLIWAIWY